MATFYTGNTGASTGPHLDFRVWDPRTGGWINPNQFTGIMRSGEGGISQFPVTSGYGMRTHPTRGGRRMHHGIDYGTAAGTAITIPGARHLTTWDDKGGGGITSQYEFMHEGKPYEAFLMHGSDKNPIYSSAAVTDGKSLTGAKPIGSQNPPSPVEPSTVSPTDSTPTDIGTLFNKTDTAVDTQKTTEAADRVAKWASMSKSELNNAYDSMRGSADIDQTGMEMHKAFFGKK